MKGTIFAINEFTLHDGPGCRVTVFMKGCPLRCRWCHNPEGLSVFPQLMCKTSLCTHCGECYKPCKHEECKPYGRCIHACPNDLLTISGKEYKSNELAEKISSYSDFLTDGGVTFSGGEPLMQIDFIEEVCKSLKMHKAIQTSGYADAEKFKKALNVVDYVLMDIKIADRQKHFEYTGVYNDKILYNYQLLLESGKPHVIRIPQIPGITDSPENIEAIAKITRKSTVEIMPYNGAAGAKYEMVGLTFNPGIGEKNKIDLSVFTNASYV